MGSIIAQSIVVITMNIKSISRRLWMSMAMVLASAVVVAILLAFLAMANGFAKTLSGAGAEDVAIVMRSGSSAELNSTILRESVNILETAPGIQKIDGRPMVSAELYVIIDGKKKTTQTKANIPLRGIDTRGVGMRSQFKLEQGRLFKPGTNEIIVGQGLLREFDGLELNQEVRSGKNTWRVVGIFSMQGSVFESEIWADTNFIQTLYQRGNSFQTARIKLTDPSKLDDLKAFVDSDARLNLSVQSEAKFFANQGDGLKSIAILGTIISTIMALGAIAGALNTMYNSVADRAKEIATLRALGFSNISAFIGTLVEALILSALGGIVGACAAFLLFDGVSASTLAQQSFSQVVFRFELSTELIFQGIFMALIIGFISGFFPAWRASNLSVVVAFQSDR